MRYIARIGLFETNSSGTHAISIFSVAEWQQFLSGNAAIRFNEFDETGTMISLDDYETEKKKIDDTPYLNIDDPNDVLGYSGVGLIDAFGEPDSDGYRLSDGGGFCSYRIRDTKNESDGTVSVEWFAY